MARQVIQRSSSNGRRSGIGWRATHESRIGPGSHLRAGCEHQADQKAASESPALAPADPACGTAFVAAHQPTKRAAHAAADTDAHPGDHDSAGWAGARRHAFEPHLIVLSDCSMQVCPPGVLAMGSITEQISAPGGDVKDQLYFVPQASRSYKIELTSCTDVSDGTVFKPTLSTDTLSDRLR